MSGITCKRLTRMSSALATLFVLAAVPASAAGPIVHRVSVGGPDGCIALANSHPGCDANFSLVAMQSADGSVWGQFTDRFDEGEGFHAVITCLAVDGNNAWVSGVIIEGTLGGTDLAGRSVATRVQDNGTSAKGPADKISYSWLGDARPCTMKLNYVLFDAPEGQVNVK